MKVQERPCRACQSPLETVLDLGLLALSTFPSDVADIPDLPRAPLELCRCAACGLVQLRHTVEPDALFRRYWYQSGVNETMRAELEDVVDDARSRLGMIGGAVVVDVGANDGTLLSFYPRIVHRVAFEPAENLREVLQRHCDELHSGYFPGPISLMEQPARNVRILTSIACFYATDAPVSFVRGVDTVLADDGIWVVQFQDLQQLLEATAFDDICHEHIFYPCLASVERLLAPFDLHVIDAERRAINGGSLRLTIGRRWRPVSPSVEDLRDAETGCEDFLTLATFAERVYAMRDEIRQRLDSRSDQIVDIYGASTKGNTLLQFCNIGPSDIRQVWERSPEKWGRYTVTGIPIVSETIGRVLPPDMLLVLIWQFRDAIIQRERAYLEAGGQLLFPLPQVEVVDSDVL